MKDPPGQTTLATQEAVVEASKKRDKIGIGRPIKDELELDEFMPKDQVAEQDVTSNEESELGGLERPKRGRGWLGVGPTLLLLRKGISQPFIDGAGLCSPGRWPIDRRRLPDNDLARQLRTIVTQVLKSAWTGFALATSPKTSGTSWLISRLARFRASLFRRTSSAR